MPTLIRRSAHALLLAIAASLLWMPRTADAVQQACGTSAGYDICLSATASTLTGDQTITATISGPTDGIAELIFAWGSTRNTTAHLLTDFQSPYRFTWRTDQYVDATQYLNVKVETWAGTVGAPCCSLQLTLDNGNEGSVAQNPTDWASIFDPRPASGDPVIAAVGDGGDGTVRADNVAAALAASDASALLYLGDLYERGTPAEFDENYGRASFDRRSGASSWGALASWTRPTLGNHESFNIPSWRNYWHGRPNWETFVYGGVRFLNLNSECAYVGGCGTASDQYRFVQDVLATNTQPCVVAYWHRAVLGAVDPDNTEMRPIWALLANNGGDLVLSGHIHDMEAYAPLNANLEAGKPDSHMVELVSGAGGHHLTRTVGTDPRMRWQATKIAGAVYLKANDGSTGRATSIDWAFRDVNGAVVSGSQGQGTGHVDCGSGGTPPPPPPGGTIFQDDFSNGLAAWTGVVGWTRDDSQGATAPPSARANVSSARATASRDLGAGYDSICMSEEVKLSSIGSDVALMRLRTVSDGPVGRVYVHGSTRELWVRSDFSGTQRASGDTLPLGSWQTVELCGTIGTSGTWELFLNGSRILGPWTANNGTAKIGRVELGDGAMRTFTANVDDVIVR